MSRRMLVSGLVLAVVAVLGFSAVPARAGEGDPWAAVVGPGFIRYIPGVDRWEVGFKVVGDGWEQSIGGALTGLRVLVNGSPVQTVSWVDAPWGKVDGHLSQASVREVRQSALDELHGRAPSPVDLPHLERAALILEEVLAEVPPIVLTLEGMAGLAEGEYTLDVSLDFQVGDRSLTLSEPLDVVVAAIPTAPGWFAGDYHMHSTYSDGTKSLITLTYDLGNAGYYIGYVTDHTASLISSGAFTSMTAAYPSACRTCSSTSTSMFPGVEIEIGHTVLGIWNGDGHCLGYGVASTSGLNDKYWGPQAGLDQINANNGTQSNSGIAHPAHPIYNWEDWTVLRYYGIELMSGPQTYFDVYAGHPSRWRSECARLQASSSSYKPSVRTGSDCHSTWQTYVTHVKLASDSTWFNGTWEQRRAAVDAALKAGKTTISRKGSLPYITADGYEVGSTYTKASGAAVSFTIYLKPAVTGTYNLYLYRDNLASTVWSKTSQALTAGTAYTWTTSYTYPGSNHYYWLYVSGADYGYTTPIYLRQ